MTQTFRARTRFLFSGVLALWLAAPAASDGLSGAYLAARQAMIANDFQEAAEYYARALARDRTNAFLIENTLIANVGLGRIKESVPIARVLIADEPGSQIGQIGGLLAPRSEGVQSEQGTPPAVNGRQRARHVGHKPTHGWCVHNKSTRRGR